MGESNMVGTVIHALSIDPPIRRDAFFMYLMTEVPAPAPWPDGLHTCLRLQHAPVSVQRAVVAAFAVEAPKLTAATRMKCLAAMHRRISDVIILSFLERGDLLRPNTTSVNGIVEASSRKSAFALEGTSLLEDFTRTRSLVGMQPSLAADDVESIPRQGEVSCDVAKEDHRIIERAEEGESPGRELNNECDDTRRDGKRARTVLPEGAVVCTSSVEASLASPQKSKHRGTAAAAAGSQAEHVVTGEGQLCRDATEDALSAKDEAIIARVRVRLEALPSHATEGNLPADLLTLVRDASPLDKVLQQLRLTLLQDEVLLLVTAVICPTGCALRQAVAFISVVLYPRVRDLTQPASRALLSAVVTVAKRHPRAAVSSMVLPLLSPQPGAPSPGSAQVEVVNRLAKDALPTSTLSDLVAQAVQPSIVDNAATLTPLSPGWVAVLHLIMGLRPALPPHVMADLVNSLEATARSPRAAAALKLSSLVLAIVSKYVKEAKEQLPQLAQVAELLPQTGVKKAVIAAIARARQG